MTKSTKCVLESLRLLIFSIITILLLLSTTLNTSLSSQHFPKAKSALKAGQGDIWKTLNISLQCQGLMGLSKISEHDMCCWTDNISNQMKYWHFDRSYLFILKGFDTPERFSGTLGMNDVPVCTDTAKPAWHTNVFNISLWVV